MTKSFVYTSILVAGIFCVSLYYSAQALAAEKGHSDSHKHGEKGHSDKHEDGQKRQLDSHEHGVSVLKIAAEKNMIEMELESPANDIVGFEHAPENEKQKSQINKALAIFKDKKGVFMPTPAAGCKITGHSAEFESDPSSGHAGFHVKWKMSCSNPSKIKNLSTSFFKSFRKAEEIEVEVVSDAGQKEIEWEKDQNKIKLRLSK